jgi:hypothetical protein
MMMMMMMMQLSQMNEATAHCSHYLDDRHQSEIHPQIPIIYLLHLQIFPRENHGHNVSASKQ